MQNQNLTIEYQKKYHESIIHPQQFWEKEAEENIHFFTKWTEVFSFENYSARWFDGGLLNVSYNCLDRHLLNENKNKIALIWEGEDGEYKKFSYAELHLLVCQFSNALETLGAKTGDHIVIYMPLIPEAVIAMLSCTRIGAPHTVVFGGFSAESLADRIKDCEAKFLITADGGLRKGAVIPMKKIADEACLHATCVEKIIVVNRIKNKKEATNLDPVVVLRDDIKLDRAVKPRDDTEAHDNITQNRDVFWDDIMAKSSATHHAKPLPSEHPLFMLYTSGTTGKPKGLVHTTAGYLLGTHLSAKWIFQFTPNDILWTTADIGWITGHSYLVYGPLSNGATVFMYEGAPLYPNPGRFWEMIEKHKISILYTAPTAIRTFVKFGQEWPDKYNLSSLRLLGTVGEPIGPDTWEWYAKVIGKNKCPIVDTWWQTETGSVLITSIPHVTLQKPGCASLPFFGVDPVILDSEAEGSDIKGSEGHDVPSNQSGFLCIKKPWPSIARTIYKDHERYIKTYWQKIEGVYFTGDGAHRDSDGYYWITGRIDDVLNVSGHRLSTAEIENAILTNTNVAECAVVGISDAIKGQAPVAFVMVKSGIEPSSELKNNIQKNIESSIGHFVRAEHLYFVLSFPKTRSGKMMRRLLREFAQTGNTKGDVSTLEESLRLHT